MGICEQAEDEEAAAAAAAAEGNKDKQEHGKLSMQERLAMQRQIFKPREAFSMLSRELKDVMRQNESMLEVDTVDHDVYHWDVHLYDFKNSKFAEVSKPFWERMHLHEVLDPTDDHPTCMAWLGRVHW